MCCSSIFDLPYNFLFTCTSVKLRVSISILCSHPVRRASANVVSIIAKYAIPAGEWPELLPFLFQCSQSPQDDHREVSLSWWRVYSYQADEYRHYSYWRRMTLWFPIRWIIGVDVKHNKIVFAMSFSSICSKFLNFYHINS